MESDKVELVFRKLRHALNAAKSIYSMEARKQKSLKLKSRRIRAKSYAVVQQFPLPAERPNISVT